MNIEYLKKSQEAADYCSKKFKWKIIECCTSSGMKPIDEINKEIVRVINDLEMKK